MPGFPIPRRVLPRLMAGALLLPLALAGCAAPPPVATDPTFYADLSKGGQLDPEAAASLVSDYRRGRGLPAVALDPVLMRVAEQQAKAMAAADELSHSVGGRGFVQRLKSAGWTGLTAVENVGAGYHTLAEAFSGWRDSPSHNKNMLAPGMTKIGIAAVAVPRSRYRVYWAMVLGKPDPKVEAAAQAAAAPAGSAPAASGATTVTFGGATVSGQ
ncbi:CAP domain-containing protein [Ancylobacter oerskovii]|uniref:CAP domain-containing protein n=1 Tax=Ancylobacter oerskovii TaxID=459519 RepID=A0ABW4YT38_9HYPH|nr:CAP domain-containing protein [Ancylobacter oerskovii]MBS7543527.1 CAP domain-containing protein [Ancylobacter oerskovii]